MQVNSEVVDSWVLNQELGYGWANQETFSEQTIQAVQLNPGDILTLQGIGDMGEFARVDYLNLIPVDAA